MVCEGCDERMTRETVVFVIRGRARIRSIAQPGWYCWTCKTSMHTASDMVERAPEPLRRRIMGSFRPARLVVRQDRHA